MSLIFTKNPASKLAAAGALLALLLGTATAEAQTVDGTRDASYPVTALAVQANPTKFSDNTISTGGVANGSELDNIHTQIVGTNLYVFLGGNLATNNNKLELFFDSKAGGQNTLSGGSGNLSNQNGLTFDAGFMADYLVSVGANVNDAGSFSSVYVDYGVVGGTGGYVGGGNTAQTSHALDFDFGSATLAGEVALNNSNTVGVTTTTVGDPGAVGTGIELKIPLAALYAIGQTTGPIKLSVFINGQNHDYISNQVLASLPANTGNLGGDGAGNFVPGATPVAGVNFANFADDQFVTILNGAAPVAPAITVSPTSLDFFNVATAGGTATRTFTITNNGGGTLAVSNITSDNAAYTVSATTATLVAGATATITVTFDPSTAGAQAGTITVTSNASVNPNPTISATGNGVAPGQVVVDGTVDSGIYGAAKALQTTPTSFGDMTTTSVGSELDGAYARVVGSDLYVTLTGNLESNGNKLVIFFDANPNTGQNTLAGNNPTTDNSGALAGLRFDRGFAPESFLALNLGGTSLYASFVPLNGASGFGTYLSLTGNGSTQTLDFGGGQFGELSLNNSNIAGVTGTTVGNPGAVPTGVELRIPLSVLGAGITASTPLHVMGLITSGDYTYLSNQTLGGLPNGTGNLGADGASNSGTVNTVNLGTFRGNQFFTAQRGDLEVSDTRDIAGDYNNITVTATGRVSVFSPLDVTSTLLSQGNIGFAPTPDAIVTGTGSTTIAGVLAIGSPQGISASGPTGSVQTAGRTFGTSSGYVYIGVGAQVTGSGLPGTVDGLSVNNAAGVTLSQAVDVRQVVNLLSGNLNTNGQALKLLSLAAGTALVVNTGGIVNGPTGTMQRYIGTNTNQNGYRHYSSPVQSEIFSTLAAGSYTPNFSGATDYNNSATPGMVKPFPTVFAYNQDRIAASLSNYTIFDKGFEAITSGSQLLEVGRGYAVQAPGSILVDFTGQFTNGSVTRAGLNRSGATDFGWHLLGNPYPSPIDWSTLTLGAGQSLENMDAAVYVVQSSGPYSGTYRTYVAQSPNDAANTPIIPAGQGFFVHTTAGTAGTLRLTNGNRVTSFGVVQPSFGRGSADERPVVRLHVRNAAGTSADQLTLYADAKATAGVDAAYDATKLSNPSGLNLSAVSATGETLAIDARPAFTVGTAIALRLGVPTAGTYTLSATSVANLPAGLTAYLHDAATGQQVNLSSQPTTTVSLTAGLSTRYSVVFAAANALASAPTLTAAQVALYPNPTGKSASVLVTLPVPVGTRAARATVLNALGQVVSVTTLTVQAGQASGSIRTAALAAGVYVVRLQAGAELVSKRLVVE